MREKINDFIRNLSYENRKKGNFEYINKKINAYYSMPYEEFLMEYSDKIANYEYKKYISLIIYLLLSFVFVTVIICYFIFICYIDKIIPSSLKNNAIEFSSSVLMILIITISTSFIKRNIELKRLIREKILIEQIAKIKLEKIYEQRK